MSYTKIMSEKAVWCSDDDRHILIKKEHGEVVGLNFCQGDDIEHFYDHFLDIDHELTDFYNSVKDHLSGLSELDRINQAIWAHFEFKNLQDARKSS